MERLRLLPLKKELYLCVLTTFLPGPRTGALVTRVPTPSRMTHGLEGTYTQQPPGPPQVLVSPEGTKGHLPSPLME